MSAGPAAESVFGNRPELRNRRQETDACFNGVWWDLPVS